MERTLSPWSRPALVPQILPAFDGVTERLQAGAQVADVGCGSGFALLTLAAAFPASQFDGYDPSRYAIERAEANSVSRGLANVAFHQKLRSGCPPSRSSTWSSPSTACTTCPTQIGLPAPSAAASAATAPG